MSKDKIITELATWGLTVAGVALWAVFGNPSFGTAFSATLSVGELLGLSAGAMFSTAIILSARPRVAERLFGNPGKLYSRHAMLGKVATLFAIAHFIVVGIAYSSGVVGFLEFFTKWNPAKILGAVSVVGIAGIVYITLLSKIKYDKWLSIHKVIGIFYILGMLHAFRIPGSSLASVGALKLYFGALTVIAISVWVYRSVLGRSFNKIYKYRIADIRKLNDFVIEIHAVSESKKYSIEDIRPGQFVFAEFKFDKRYRKEKHPFTVSGFKDGEITFNIKRLGDYTEELYDKIKEGCKVEIEGPFGDFMPENHSSKQIWVAGGIGITPFLATCNRIGDCGVENKNIFLAHLVRNDEENLFEEKFESLRKKLAGDFDFIVHRSDDNGFIKSDDILRMSGFGDDLEELSVLICGPKNMRDAIAKQFVSLGVPANNIHWEDFSFR